MTNHPRRAGRRKHQRQALRTWVDLTPYVTDVRLSSSSPAGVSVNPANPDQRVVVWGNGRLDFIGIRRAA